MSLAQSSLGRADPFVPLALTAVRADHSKISSAQLFSDERLAIYPPALR